MDRVHITSRVFRTPVKHLLIGSMDAGLGRRHVTVRVARIGKRRGISGSILSNLKPGSPCALKMCYPCRHMAGYPHPPATYQFVSHIASLFLKINTLEQHQVSTFV